MYAWNLQIVFRLALVASQCAETGCGRGLLSKSLRVVHVPKTDSGHPKVVVGGETRDLFRGPMCTTKDAWPGHEERGLGEAAHSIVSISELVK